MPKITIEIEVTDEEARAVARDKPVYVMWSDSPPSDDAWWIDGYASIQSITEVSSDGSD